MTQISQSEKNLLLSVMITTECQFYMPKKKKKKKRKWKEQRNQNWRHINLHPDQANRKFIQQRRKLINVCGIALSIIDPDSVACKDAA